jgi:hypothetical protein
MIEYNVFYGKYSGFFVFRSKGISLAMNLLGHQGYYWAINVLEPRLIGGVPFWLTYKKKSLIPSIPYNHGLASSGPKTIPHGIKISRFLNSLKKWRTNKPYYAGFLSYLEKRNEHYISQGFNSNYIKETESGIYISGKANLFIIKKYSLNVIVYFFKDLISLIFKHPMNKKNIVKKTNIIIKKKIYINNEMMYINDLYPKDMKNYKLISFTLRTFDNVNKAFFGDFICFISRENNTYIAVSINKNEKIIKPEKAYSSTGKCKIWKIVDPTSLFYRSNNERVLLFGDNINDVYKLKPKEYYLKKAREEMGLNNDN